MFEARSVALRYGSHPVLAETSIAVRPGELTVVVGPNGAGKTSLLRILSGETAPTSGEVRVGGRALKALKPRELAGLRAVLPQSSHLAFPFTVLEVVRLGCLAGGSHDAGRLALDMLGKVDLDGFADRYFQNLSGGEKQRVHLARVLCQLATSPRPAGEKALFLDEPVSSLDIGHQIRIMEIAREGCSAGSGVLAILHDLNLAALFADRIVLMRAGRVLADGPPSDIVTAEWIERGFGIRALVNVPPLPPRPYVLPQSCSTVP